MLLPANPALAGNQPTTLITSQELGKLFSLNEGESAPTLLPSDSNLFFTRSGLGQDAITATRSLKAIHSLNYVDFKKEAEEKAPWMMAISEFVTISMCLLSQVRANK